MVTMRLNCSKTIQEMVRKCKVDRNAVTKVEKNSMLHRMFSKGKQNKSDAGSYAEIH
jgi:hypothetical protein